MAEDYRDFSDERLAALVREGEPEAFVELSTRYMGLVRGKAQTFSGPGAPEKEDLFQEGFLGLYAAARGFRPGEGRSFSSYAGACVYNRMASLARSRQTPGNRALSESVPLEGVGELPAPGNGPEDRYELGESFRAMWRRAEEVLSPLELRVLGLYLSGLRRDEVERRAGMGLKTFDNALHRVRAKLRDKAGEKGGKEPE